METNISFRDLTSYDYASKANPWSVKQNVDELSPLTHWRFENPEEAALAALLWINDADKNINDFRGKLKAVLRIIGVKSAWSE